MFLVLDGRLYFSKRDIPSVLEHRTEEVKLSTLYHNVIQFCIKENVMNGIQNSLVLGYIKSP